MSLDGHGTSTPPSLPSSSKLAAYGGTIVGLWVVAGVVQLLRGWWLIDNLGRPVFSNYLCFWAAGKLAMAGSAAASYDWHTIGQIEAAAVAPGLLILPWLYPPSFLLVFAPLSHLPYLWSCAIWLILTGLAYLFSMLKVLPHRLTILLALAAPTAMFNVIETETGFMVAALVGFALAMLERRPVLAGLAIGVLTMKPQFGLLFPFILIASGNWRGFWSAAATALVIVAVTCLAFGPAVWSTYLHAMPTVGAAVLGEGDRVRLMDGGTIAWCDIQTWYGVARYLEAPPGLTWMVYGATTGACLLLVSWLWRQPVSHNLKSAATAVAVPLVTPYMMSYDLVVVAVAIAFLVRENLRSGFRRGDIEIYIIALAAPLYPLFVNGIVPLLPLFDSLLFAWILHRAWGARAEQRGESGSLSNEQSRGGVPIGASPAR